ncbi:Bulb-type lectin domain-containing protein [Heracleum sosnowskyi]|uniref:Bulb-type lectin domain-containing protein n=1 Tax=Heracleum sosnowskyi TaxID=360622 RepID=A0AAD8HRT3_9APIA|nr:Bulb-type lectin domain-containing protein [Heracleum sosnowskyi]
MSYSSSYILCIFFSLLPFSALAQSNGNGTISVGSSLTARDKAATSWYSPSGDFAFGFRKVQDQFLLAIWYDKIPDKTIVWYVNDGTTVPAGSKVQLTADRGLVLSDSKRNEIWTSKPFSGTASSAAFNDTGNFRIVGSESSTLWDTFSNPTDTLLPTQTMGVYGELYSRRTETNFTRGRFQLRLLNDGNLVLNTRNILTDFPYDAYYWSNTYSTNPINQGYQVKFNESGYMYILKRNGDIVELTTSRAIPSTGYYHRVTLNNDGVLVQYYHPKVFTETTEWTIVWQEPENICTAITERLGGGACGFNSICKFDGSKKDCECPETYSLLDLNDKHGGCKPNFTQNCDRNDSIESLYDFVEKPGTDYPLSSYERMKPISEPECKRLCSIDCFCVAAYYEEDNCWKKKLPLGNGRKDNSVRGKTFLKFSKGDLHRENHPVIVAVKKIDRLIQDGAQEFKTEVNAIAQTHHKNLIICCRRSVEDIQFGDKAILTDWVWDCYQDSRMCDFIDVNNEDMLSDWEKVERFVMVGIWCIQEDPSLRPTMRKAIQMLEGVADIPYPPCPSPLSWTST